MSMSLKNRIVRSVLPRTNNMAALEHFENKGIYFHQSDIAVFDDTRGEKSLIGMDTRIAMDADTWSYGPASNGVPFQFLTEYTKPVIEQILFKRAYNEIGRAYQQGSFSTQRFEIALQNLIGQVDGYGDFNNDGLSDINNTWSPRDVYLFQTMIQYGDLEVEALNAAKIDAIGSKRYSASQSIAIALNKLFFFGNQTSSGVFISNNFGLLNDPNLNPSFPAPTGNWATASAILIFADINRAFQALGTQLGNNITQASPLQLCLALEAGTYLATVTTLGISVYAMIQSTYPNLSIVYAPEYKSLGTSSPLALGGFQLIAPNALREGSVWDLFTYKYRSHGTVRLNSGWREKISSGSGGAGVGLPAGVVTVTGL